MTTKINKEIKTRTRDLFLTMFRAEVRAGKPFIVDTDRDCGWDFSGVVSITGSLSGLIVLRFTEKLAVYLFELAMLKNAEGRTRLLDDMVCEIANTLAGNLLSTSGLEELYMSVPVSVRGPGHLISWPKNTEVCAVPFRLGTETFVVQTGLK